MIDSLPILRRASLRELGRQPWQTGLTLLGIALGVAIVVAVDLANSSARRAFALSLASVSGTATHQLVGGPQGIEDALFTRLRLELGFRRSAPLVLGTVSVGEHRFTLMGVDLLSERDLGRHFEALNQTLAVADGGLWQADSVALHRETAAALGVSAGDTLSLSAGGGGRALSVGAVFRGGDGEVFGGLLFADIALAQELLGRLNFIDRIDLALQGDEAARLRAWLPPGLRLVESEGRNGSLQAMSEAFHLNLSAMSLLALLVAGLLIYNTVSFSVLRRRRTLGIYRALGLSRGELLRMVGAEAALLGVVGSAGGLALGLVLGQGLVQLVTRTINDLYFHLHVTTFVADPLSLVKGLVLGFGVTAVAAAGPAREAAFSTPVTVQQRASLERRRRWVLPLLALLGLVLMGLGQLLLGGRDGTLLQGFAGLVLQVFAYCLLVPGLVLLLSSAMLHLLPGSAPLGLRLALRGIGAGISRTGMAVSALTVAVSVTVGVGVMVGSFRESVIHWLAHSLSGDVYVSAQNPHRRALPERLRVVLEALPDSGQVARRRWVQVETDLGPLGLLARDLSPAEEGEYRLLSGVEGVWDDFREGRGVLISEPLAWRQGLTGGDSFILHTAAGPRAYPVLGVFRDYSSSRGMLLMDLMAYRAAWGDPIVSGLVLRAAPGSNPANLLDAVREELARWGDDFQAVANGTIRDNSLAVFDRTFAITHVLRLLAILVAFVGVLSALMSLQLERGREYAVLRATGMTPAQLARQILTQTGLLGLLAGLLALPLGLLMSEVLIDVINRRSFGWSMATSLPARVLFEALLLALAAALAAGLYPAWRAARVRPALALREE